MASVEASAVARSHGWSTDPVPLGDPAGVTWNSAAGTSTAGDRRVNARTKRQGSRAGIVTPQSAPAALVSTASISTTDSPSAWGEYHPAGLQGFGRHTIPILSGRRPRPDFNGTKHNGLGEGSLAELNRGGSPRRSSRTSVATQIRLTAPAGPARCA